MGYLDERNDEEDVSFGASCCRLGIDSRPNLKRDSSLTFWRLCRFSQLKQGTKLELPFWMAQALARRKHVIVDLPNVFGSRFKSTLIADPTVVNLADRCPYYYELGIKFAEL
jgi:hypothetical protein